MPPAQWDPPTAVAHDQHAAARRRRGRTGRGRRSTPTAGATRPARSSSAARSRFAPTCGTCCCRSATRTCGSIRAARRTGPTTSRAGRCRCRWACGSTPSTSPSRCRRDAVELAAPVADGEALADAVVFAVDARVNNSVRLVNRIFAAGGGVERLAAPLDSGDTSWPPGTFLVPATDVTRPLVRARRGDRRRPGSRAGVSARRAARHAARAPGGPLPPVGREHRRGVDALRARAVRLRAAHAPRRGHPRRPDRRTRGHPRAARCELSVAAERALAGDHARPRTPAAWVRAVSRPCTRLPRQAARWSPSTARRNSR